MSYVQPAIVIEGRSQRQVAAGTASNPLEAGVYDVWCAVDAYIHVSADGASPMPTNTTGYLIPAGRIVPIRIGRDGLKLASSANLNFHRVE